MIILIMKRCLCFVSHLYHFPFCLSENMLLEMKIKFKDENKVVLSPLIKSVISHCCDYLKLQNKKRKKNIELSVHLLIVKFILCENSSI